MYSPRVIISTHNTLEALGMSKLLREAFDIDAHIVDNDFFADTISSAEPDFFFIDQETLVTNLTFFLPRKAKTVVLTSNDKSIDDMTTVNITAHEHDIVNTLNPVLEAHDYHENASNTLSARETEVLRLIASGKINKEIAHDLNISINTVLSHRKNITTKLGIKSVSGLSFYAMMNGIV